MVSSTAVMRSVRVVFSTLLGTVRLAWNLSVSYAVSVATNTSCTKQQAA